MVEWDDSKVIRTYSGSDTGYVTATISYNGTFKQVLRYKVIVEDRTVTGFTNVLKAGMGEIQPYKYSYVDDVSKAVVEDYFIKEGSEFVVEFGNMRRKAEEKSITFSLGASATANSMNVDGSKIQIGDTEKNLVMGFVLDSARGLGHKGKDARFYITIPGFDLGAAGQQLARFDVPVAESYVHGVRFAAPNSDPDDIESYTLTYAEWLNIVDPGAFSGDLSDNGAPAISQNNYQFGEYYYDSYFVDSPYYFISKGGIPVPSQGRVFVGPKMEKVRDQYSTLDNASYSFLSDTAWDSVVNNRSRIKYNEFEHVTSFQLDLDGQIYNFKFKISDQWVLDVQDGEEILFDEGYAYGKEEVILMPGNNIVKNGDILNVSTTRDEEIIEGSGVYRNDIYTIKFPSGRSFVFEGVAGGGSYSNNYMKWNFDMVNWNADPNVPQYATLTLGGKGGQVVKWAFFVDGNKKLVNNTIATMYSLKIGETAELQTTYKQLFSGSTLNQARLIPVEYSNGMSSYYTTGTAANDTYPLGVTREGGSYLVTAERHTPSYHYTFNDGNESQASDGSGYVGYITWDATKYRAYPNPNKSVGGRIVFSSFRDPEIEDAAPVKDSGGGNGPYDNLKDLGVYIHHPDAMFGYSEIRPLIPEQWVYPEEMSTLGAIKVTGGNSVTMPKDATNYKISYQNGRFQQSAVPVIKVEQNSMFDLRYLPTVAVTEYRPTVEYRVNLFDSQSMEGFEYDLMYLVPWQNAKVYYTARKEDPREWNPAYNAFGREEKLGFGAISTDSSREGGRYTLVVDMKFSESNVVTVYCAIDIV